jgi:uncharacterized damage-inducible protein DinB
MSDAPDLRYPIGRYVAPTGVDPAARARWIGELAALPDELAAAVAGLDDAALATPYREGGWTCRQVVHHVADSHLNAYLRCKFALTEANPTIKPYDEEAWAALPEARDGDLALSLPLVAALHRRWLAAIAAATGDELLRTYFHPGMGRSMTLHEQLAMYAWHGRHHVAHITALRARRGW